MLSEDKYFHTLSEDELWQRYCGFLDLSVDKFMEIQNELLMEQIELVSDSLLGRKIMGDHKPKSVEEFRRIVPLTTYDDYEPYLSEKQEDALATKPHVWCHSSGRGGSFKWVPHSAEILDRAVRSYIAGGILSSCRRKGEIRFGPGARVLVIVAPPPYVSGTSMLAFSESLTMHIMPPLQCAESEEFLQRIREGFRMALRDGVDYIGALASVLVRMGEEFAEQTSGMKFSVFLLHPKVAFRLLRAWLRAKLENRVILPKDIWKLSGILASGVDTAIYKEKVAYYWGVAPIELYSGTEGQSYALQSWTKKALVFIPDSVFLEFIPHDEVLKAQDDKNYHPTTVLTDELEKDKLYEVVITQFYGMPLLRYRLNDIIKVTAKSDDETGIELPQIVFQHRVGELINIGGLANLDEKVVWQAIVNTNIKCTEWAASKEYDGDQSFLRLYMELREKREPTEVAQLIDEQLNLVDTDYKDIHSYLGLNPVRVTLLSPGTFQRYTEEKTKEGADLAHLKPAHMNPPEPVIQRLIHFSEMNKVG